MHGWYTYMCAYVMALTLTNQRLLKLLPSINSKYTRTFCIADRYFLFSRRKSFWNVSEKKRIKSYKQFTMKYLYIYFISLVGCCCSLLPFFLLLFKVCNCWSRFFFIASYVQVQWKEMSFFCFIFFILPPLLDDLLVFLILSISSPFSFIMKEMHSEFLWERVPNLILLYKYNHNKKW